jgi:sterol desaturase/sphingolipid hydroxylase (fatty acid hydroxylase superfamily)
MEKLMAYFSAIPPAHRLGFVFGGLLFFWLIEGYYPLFRFSFKRLKHAGVNGVFLITTLLLNILFGIFTIKVCRFTVDHQFGLFNWFSWPIWPEVILGVFMMDFFSQYLPHWLMHKVKFMWKFHMVHHSDTKVDVTTGTRHHPGEWLFREFFAIIGILMLGLPVGLYFLYRSTAALFTHFNHANIRMPFWLDKLISSVFVSPNMHKVHHHFQRPLTDSNYANIFSLWDKLFGTFRYTDVHSLKYGLDVLSDTNDENLGYQFKLPFDNTVKTDY